MQDYFAAHAAWSRAPLRALRERACPDLLKPPEEEEEEEEGDAEGDHGNNRRRKAET